MLAQDTSPDRDRESREEYRGRSSRGPGRSREGGGNAGRVGTLGSGVDARSQPSVILPLAFAANGDLALVLVGYGTKSR